MINSLKDITDYDGNKFAAHLEKLCLYDIFVDVLREYAEDAPRLKGVIHYIAWAYSVNSPKVHDNADWQLNKKRIFEQVGLPDQMWREVGELDNQAIVSCIDKWLEYQDSDAYTEFVKLKDLLSFMQRSYNVSDVSYDQKMKNADYCAKLRDMIRDKQAELMEGKDVFREAVKEVRAKKTKTSLGPETFAKSK